MHKIKVAQIGTSKLSHGYFVFNTVKTLTDYFEIAGYALPENEDEKFPDVCKAFNGYKRLTLDEILNDETIEAVFVETEEIYLTKYALMAAKAGKHIHMEKPGGIVPEEFSELIAVMRESKKVFHTGYMYRYNPEIIKVIKDVRNGKFGTITSVEAQMNCPHSPQNREYFADFPGGILFFLGCHLIDLILQIQGKPLSIKNFNKSTNIDGVNSVDYSFNIFNYENGTSFCKVNATEKGGFLRRQLVITGSKKTVEFKPLEIVDPNNSENLLTYRTEYNTDDWKEQGTKTVSASYNRYDTMLKHFYDVVFENIENEYTLDYEAELYYTILKCSI